jgi:hypothetical protein
MAADSQQSQGKLKGGIHRKRVNKLMHYSSIHAPPLQMNKKRIVPLQSSEVMTITPLGTFD